MASDEDRQVTMQTMPAHYEKDEIDLFDLLQVLWKRRILIIGGTFLFALVAAITSLLIPKIYRADMVIRPGILSIGEGGKNVYIDTPENVKALIETGTFNREILNTLEEAKAKNIPETIEWIVNLPRGSSAIKIGYESSDSEQAVNILNLLTTLLKGKYKGLVNYYRAELERDISLKEAEVQSTTAMKKSHESNLKNIAKRIRDLEGEIQFTRQNTGELMNERRHFLMEKKDPNNILSALLYANTIQQNLQLANNLKMEVKDLKLDTERESQEISYLNQQITQLFTEIQNLKFKKAQIENIDVLRKPEIPRLPVKPKKKLIVALATTTGLFLMVLTAFLLEIIDRNRPPEAS